MTVTDHNCSKAMIFIPCREMMRIEEMIKQYMRHVVIHYKLPIKIILDWDPQLIAELFKEPCQTFQIKQNMSTAYHPQIDRQSEQTNQTLEMFLRIFCNHQQNNWVKLLPITQYTLNTWPSSITKKAPFKTLMGYIPIVHQHAPITRFQNISDQLEAIKLIRWEAQTHMTHAQQLVMKASKFQLYVLS